MDSGLVSDGVGMTNESKVSKCLAKLEEGLVVCDLFLKVVIRQLMFSARSFSARES